MLLKIIIQTLQPICWSFLVLSYLGGRANADNEPTDIRTFSDITVVRPFSSFVPLEQECRKWADNFQLLATASSDQAYFRIRARSSPKSRCPVFAKLGGKTTNFLLSAFQSTPIILREPISKSYWTGKWTVIRRIKMALQESQLNADEIQIYRPNDAITEAWNGRCISVFDKIMVRKENSLQSFYLIALSNSVPFIRPLGEDTYCPNWKGESSASQFAATFDIDGGRANDTTFFFDRTFGTLLLLKSPTQRFCVFIPKLGTTYAYLSEGELKDALDDANLITSIAGMTEQSSDKSRRDSRDAAGRLLQSFKECNKW